MPFSWWVNLEIHLEGSDAALSDIPLPATSDYMEIPNLEFNAIKEMQQIDALIKILTKSFEKLSKV